MQPQEFCISTTSRVKGTATQGYEVLSKPRELTRSKGKPYVLEWQAEMTAATKPHPMSIRARGGLEGLRRELARQAAA